MEFGFVLATLAVLGFALVLLAAHLNAEPVRGKPEVFEAANWWTAKVKLANDELPEGSRLNADQLHGFSLALANRIAEYHDDHGCYPQIAFSSLDGKLHPVLAAAREQALVFQRGFCHPDGPSLPKTLALPLPEGIFEMTIGDTEIQLREREVVLDQRAFKHFGFVREDAAARQPEFKAYSVPVTPFA
jgi:hypothetical protein